MAANDDPRRKQRESNDRNEKNDIAQIQHAALKAAGCKVIRSEKASGTRRDGRSELQVLLDFVHAGDTLVVTRIDRLARSLKDLQDIVYELRVHA